MVSNKKQLYMASTLEELKVISNNILIRTSFRKNPIKLMSSIKELNKKFKELLSTTEQDEELIFLIMFRMMLIWELLTSTDEFQKDPVYYKCMLGREITRAVMKMEELECSLKKRYETEAKKQNIPEVKTSERKTPEVTDLEKESLEFITDSNEVIFSQVEEPVSITSTDLRDRLLRNENILIIDTRPKEDFNSSKFVKGKIINIPNSIIKPGISAAVLRNQLLSVEDKIKWDERSEYKQIIMLDWKTEEKTLAPGSTLHILKNIFLKWDPTVTYKKKPLILEGGYERFLDQYPHLTSNPNPERPTVSDGLQFVPLDEIQYPMADLTESIIPLRPKNIPQLIKPQLIKPPSESSSGFSSFTPSPVPAIDRSTKPEQVKSSSSALGVESDSLSLDDSSMNESESRADEMVVIPDPISSKPFADISNPTISKKDGLPTVMPSVTPSTKFASLKKPIADDIGDGDSDISTVKLRSDDSNSSASFSSGLKRSRSSPNIAQLKDDTDLTSKFKPQIDRTSKPSPRSSDSFSPRSHGTVPRGLTGLKNLGNLCYMNSIIQCVSNTEELKNQLISINQPCKINKNSKTKGQVFDAVKQLICLLHQGNYRWVTCQMLKNVVGQFRNTFAGYDQQDSHEFLTELMDWLHEDLNCPTSDFTLKGASEETGERAWGEFKKKNESIVLELFYGQLRSTITCSECSKQSVTFDPFSNLSLPLPMDKDKCRLSDCIRLYLTGETITGWNCPRCKVPRQAVKKFDITRLPPVLVIHLKRFMTEGLGFGWSRKRPNMVDFPLEDLDMKQYAVNSEQRFHTYNLYAVSNHYGTMDSGHYTAYCKNYSHNKWYKFDDQEVADLSPSEVKTSAAYILFYSTVRS